MLDGNLVTNDEVTNSTEKYSGRVTLEFLADKIGHKKFESLIELDLKNSRIRSTDGIDSSRFQNLKDLNLDNNQLIDLKGLSTLSSLVILRANQNKITDLDSLSDGLSGLKHLQVLQLANNKITSISSLKLNGLFELSVLYLQGNEIQIVDGLDDLPKLRELVLDRNKIRKLEPYSLVNLPQLRELRIEENGLKTLQNLQHCSGLHLLYVGSNRFTDFSELQYCNTVFKF